jgi:hypothetical protein
VDSVFNYGGPETNHVRQNSIYQSAEVHHTLRQLFDDKVLISMKKLLKVRHLKKKYNIRWIDYNSFYLFLLVLNRTILMTALAFWLGWDGMKMPALGKIQEK